MRAVLITGVITAGILAPGGYGQPVVDSASFKSMSLGGLHLYGVSVFSGYATSAYPGGLGILAPGAGQLGADINYGASASIGWQHHRNRSDFAFLYSGTYGGMVRYSNVNAFSQSLSLSAVRMLSPKWTLTVSGEGADLTVAQFLYQPTSTSLASQIPATMDDLAAAVSIGQFSSGQVASTLTGAPLLESPARSLLLGNRILSYSGQASLSYAYSTRLTFHLSSFSAGGQHRRDAAALVPEQRYVIPRSIGINTGVGMSYMLSPRTELGADVSGSRITNRFQTGYVSDAAASIGRKMGEHWFLQVHGGGAIREMTYQASGASTSRNVIGGGSLGFRTYRHALLGGYQRSSTDVYGFAIGTVTSVTAAWNWHRPGSRWSVFTNFAQQQIRNTGYLSISGWETGGGVAQTLASRTRMTAQYVYLSNSGRYLGNTTNIAIQSVRLTFSWVPQALSR